MLAELKEFAKKVAESNEFKERIANCYLASCFSMNEGWQLDFYNPETHKMLTFSKEADRISVQDEEDIFQRYESKIEELKIDSIKTDLDIALKKVDGLMQSKYANEKKDKAIIILQTIRGVPVWNITYLTTSLKILNAKINALTGTILTEKMENIISFKRGYK